jgi:beta-lactamase regulating signal transducer with metallopeptidase domain
MSALIESFFYCLFASMIWAPAIFFTADALAARDKRPAGAHALSGKVWPAALILAALPVLAAPIAAAFGFSLRSPAPLPPMAEFAGPAIAAVEGTMTTASDTPHTATLADVLRTAAMLYLYGFAMLLALAAIRHIWFAYRLNFAAPIDEPALEAALEHWRQRVGVARRPRYVFSHIVSSVCVYGFFRPVVVMPYNLLDRVSIEDAALMGAHEMAHVKRGDVALFALCSVAKAVFWFNPFIHRICARATLAAEQGADAASAAVSMRTVSYRVCASPPGRAAVSPAS